MQLLATASSQGSIEAPCIRTLPLRRRAVHAVKRRLFSSGDHNLVTEHVDGFKTEELVCGGIDNANLSVPDVARAHMQWCYQEDYVAVLGRQSVMGGGGAVQVGLWEVWFLVTPSDFRVRL